MRKSLLSLFAAACVFSASADKVAFIAADSEWTYTGDAKTKIIIPEGFYFTNYNDDATKPSILLPKTLACDYLNIAASGAFSAGTYGAYTTKSVESKCYVIGGALRWYTNAGWTITPAAGITITGLTIRSQSTTGKASANYVFPFTPNAADTKIDVSNVECPMLSAAITGGDKEFYLKPNGQIRISWMEFEYTGTLDQPTVPVTNVLVPYLGADQEVTLTSSAGADIYYTLDGTEPTKESTKYTGAFKLTADAVVRAIAVKGDKQSFPLFQQIFSVPAGLKAATFNWSDWQTLTLKDGSKLKADDFIPTVEGTTWPCNAAIDLEGKVFANNGVEISFKNGIEEAAAGETPEKPAKYQLFRSWSFGHVVELRPNGGKVTPTEMTLTAPAENKIKAICVIGGSIMGSPSMAATTGTFALSPIDTARGLWKGDESSVKLTGGKYVDQIYVLYAEGGAGVNEMEVNENAPVEYFNLQGVKVANPENGIFIRRQGSKVEKIMVK